MQGKIIKGIGGFYYVDCGDGRIYACRAKGIFRKQKMKPLVGDNVEFVITHEGDMEGSVENIFPRENELIRPACANVEQALVLFALRDPVPNFQILDRFLISMEMQGIPSAICFNKKDLTGEEERKEIRAIYEGSGYPVFFTSFGEDGQAEEVTAYLTGKTTLLAGPSGVGKSTLTTLCQDAVHMETGEISRKLMRGKNTTRHAELIPCGNGTYIMDTPGFTNLATTGITKEELRFYYNEFSGYEGSCRFDGCVHIHEPDCRVIDAVETGRINRVRYENYCMIYEDLKEQERRRY